MLLGLWFLYICICKVKLIFVVDYFFYSNGLNVVVFVYYFFINSYNYVYYLFLFSDIY